MYIQFSFWSFSGHSLLLIVRLGIMEYPSAFSSSSKFSVPVDSKSSVLSLPKRAIAALLESFCGWAFYVVFLIMFPSIFIDLRLKTGLTIVVLLLLICGSDRRKLAFWEVSDEKLPISVAWVLGVVAVLFVYLSEAKTLFVFDRLDPTWAVHKRGWLIGKEGNLSS